MTFFLGLNMGLSKLEFRGQIASFERRLRGAAPTPLALPYPFRTRPGSGICGLSETTEKCAILYEKQKCLKKYMGKKKRH